MNMLLYSGDYDQLNQDGQLQGAIDNVQKQAAGFTDSVDESHQAFISMSDKLMKRLTGDQ